MKALSRLQSSIINQASQADEARAAMNKRARQFVAFGALVAVGLASQANAQPLTPSNCASVGAVVGAAAGSTVSDKNAERVIAGALLGLGGAAAGHWLCSPKPARSSEIKPSEFAQAAARYSRDTADDARAASQRGKSLSLSERELMDDLRDGALSAKIAWKKALYKIEAAKFYGDTSGLGEAVREEKIAAAQFDQARGQFASTAARLHNGSDSMERRNVTDYLEVAGALLELKAEKPLTYSQLDRIDKSVKERSEIYNQHLERAAASPAKPRI